MPLDNVNTPKFNAWLIRATAQGKKPEETLQITVRLALIIADQLDPQPERKLNV